MAEAIWYYVDSARQRQGPVTVADIAHLYQSGQLAPDTLVWRDGLAAWSPLRDCQGELGLALPDSVELPPPAPAPASATAPAPAAAIDRNDIVYAGFLRRLAALFLDSLIISTAFYVVFFIVVMALGVGLTSLDTADSALAGVVLAAYLIYPAMSLAYFASLESSSLQGTVGKMALGIKVTDLDGRRIGFGRAAGRWAGSVLSYLTLYIGFFMAGFTERKRALHDFVAGTLVVDRWAYSDHPERQQREASGCLIAVVLVLLGFVVVAVIGIVAAIAIPAYSDYTGRVRVAEAIASASPAKMAVEEFVLENDRCPADAGELGGLEPASPVVESIELGGEDGRCELTLTFGWVEGLPEAQGSQLWLSRDGDGQWSCASNLSYRYLPASCR